MPVHVRRGDIKPDSQEWLSYRSAQNRTPRWSQTRVAVYSFDAD
jgi:hypothetical protein